jgi:transcription initiation factor TFIIIB Brf1 subunit/transcription initiation factor TFIIB
VYRASDAVDNEEWLARIDGAADGLGLGSAARSTAQDLFLSAMPAADRSKPAVAAASLYAAALVAGEERSQSAVAEAMGVTRNSVQSRWKALLEAAGFETPSW